jgi:NAD(P)-dependent dehydrogenase (short-subunit alcohol dehydrogenase family)
LAAARALVEGGARAIIVDLPSSNGAEVAAQLGSGVRFISADVTDEAQVSLAVDAASEFGGLDIVVNCAGIAPAARVVGKNGPVPLDLFARVVQINLIGTFNVIRLAAARMCETPNEGEERGVIITTASVAAFEGQIGQAAYSASKSGVVGMTLPIARELAAHRIRVVTIAPGLFHTPMFDSLPADAISSLASQTPHPARLGRPEEYGALVRHIVENPMLNGETIRLDGAIRMAQK